jgi:hypothetical protein
MAKQIDQATARKRLLSTPPEERTRLLKECGDWRHIVKHVLLEDMSVERYGKRFHCNAPAMLEVALERLSIILK